MDKIPTNTGKEEGVNVRITDPKDNVVYTKIIRDKGKFSFTSQIGEIKKKEKTLKFKAKYSERRNFFIMTKILKKEKYPKKNL